MAGIWANNNITEATKQAWAAKIRHQLDLLLIPTDSVSTERDTPYELDLEAENAVGEEPLPVVRDRTRAPLIRAGKSRVSTFSSKRGFDGDDLDLFGSDEEPDELMDDDSEEDGAWDDLARLQGQYEEEEEEEEEIGPEEEEVGPEEEENMGELLGEGARS
jgi:hypothetical protein